MGLVDETYRYLYDTAAYYGTGVEYLIGGIILGALIVLWILVRLFRGKKEREREIVVKVMKEDEPRISRGVLEEPEAPGGITISPGEVVIKAEGKTTRIPRDRVTVDLRGGKLEIRVLEPEEAKPIPEKKEEVEEEAEEEKVITAEEVEEAPPAAPPEEPRTLGAALKRIAKEHSLLSITLITPDGLLVDSISKAPEEDAEAAGELLSEVELGTEPAMTSVEEEEESRYLFAIPFEDTHGVFLVKSREKIPADTLSVLQEELQKSLELLLG